MSLDQRRAGAPPSCYHEQVEGAEPMVAHESEREALNSRPEARARAAADTMLSSDTKTKVPAPRVQTLASKRSRVSRMSAPLLTSVIFLIVALMAPTTRNQPRKWPLHSRTSLVSADSPTPASSHSNSNSSTTISGGRRQVSGASFATPSQAINITHVTYDPLHDTVYVGATNTIYQLNGTDLSLQYEQSTGPVLDNPACGISDCRGFEDYMKPTQNVNKVLVIDYQHKKLLSCGSTKQGACRRHQLNNIAQKEDLIPMAVAANDDNSSTYAFIAPARYTYDPTSGLGNGNGSPANGSQQQQVLYVAATYTKVGQSRELLVPAIGSRILDEGPNLLKLYENSFLDSARIDINSHLRDYFLVNYLYGFASSNYVYFVSVQKKATSRDFEELGYHTRLARICITDSSYNSYTEVDLKCVPNALKRRQRPLAAGSLAGGGPKSSGAYFASQQQQRPGDQPTLPADYPLLQNAVLVDAGSHLLQSLAQAGDQQASGAFFAGAPATPDDAKVLLAVFSSARDHTQHAGDHSALCAFSLAQIEDKFNDNIHSCYTGRMQSRNMEYIAGNVQECPRGGQAGNVVNFCHETLKINGTIPIVSQAALEYTNTTLTAVAATSQIDTQLKNIYAERLTAELGLPAGAPPPLGSGNSGPARPHTVVFAGTSNGHIKKILLNDATNGVEFEDVQLDTSDPILGDLHLHSSGDQLIAATPYKVMRVPTHNCAQYATCRECSQSRNPYCGWCLLKKSCTTKSDCGSSLAGPEQQQRNASAAARQSAGPAQAKWISGESSGKCVDLQSIVPDRIPMTSTGKVDLYVDRLPRLPREHSYKCIFNRSEQTTATQTPSGLSCPLPKLMDRQRHIQIEPGRDHALVELAVRSSETNTDFLDGRLTFFDCQRHTTCKDCLTTSWGCNWCLNENVCLFNASKCDRSSSQAPAGVSLPGQSRLETAPIIVGGSTRTPGGLVAPGGRPGGPSTPAPGGNTIGQVQQCPTFDVGHQQDIVIADGSDKELSIRVKNMPQFKGAMKCLVEIESYEISLRAQIRDDRVICENSTRRPPTATNTSLQYTYAADVGLLNGQLKVIYSDNNILIDRTNFTLYKCHLLGAHLNRPDCSLCQRIDARFQCAFCAGACRHRSRCLERPEASCPPPRIDFVHPLSGPALGGTRLTIEGSNLGQSFEEIAGRVTVGNAPCKPLEDEYRPSTRIVCVTSPVVGPHARLGQPADQSSLALAADIVVGNRAGYSVGPAKFHFKSVHLRDHQPRYGPQSGGTRLVLSGANLDIGSQLQVFLDELPCLVEPNSVSSEQLACRTTSSRQPSRAIRHLRLLIDDAQLVRDEQVFYYTADPIIHKVSPLRAYLSGGRPINVLGANLTVVQAPRMAIHDLASGRKINESLCILQDDTRMQCPSPAVNLQLMDLEFSEQNLATSYEPNSSAGQLAGGGANGKQQQVLQQDESVRFKLSFVMDNVQATSYPQLQTEIAYTSDPRLFPFASAQYKATQELDQSTNPSPFSPSTPTPSESAQTFQMEPDTYLLQPGEPSLVLYGEHLRAAVSEYEITVTVGQDLCNLTQLTQSRLVCLMPLDHMATPTDEEGHQTARALPLVVVRIGFNLRYELGFVQYHPQLVEQIVAVIANMSTPGSALAGHSSPASGGPALAHHPRLMHPAYPQYMPRESESVLHKVSALIGGLLALLAYSLLGLGALGLVYSGLHCGLRLRRQAHDDREQLRCLAKVEALERSLRDECRAAALALRCELDELERHVELKGVPLLSSKQYIMKVFFPGMSQHPLLVRSGPGGHAQAQQQNAPQQSGDLPMDQFERLVLTKPFLLAFINTLERQASFTIRDKVNVASLLMIALMNRLDYATDVMKTLLFQLVERSVAQLRSDEGASSGRDHDSAKHSSARKLTRRASNLLNGLPIAKRGHARALGGLSKIVGGSAGSLMASTSVAAQMLLARVQKSTGQLQQVNPVSECESFATPTSFHHCQAAAIGTLDCGTLGTPGLPGAEYMSTTTFNNRPAFLRRPARQTSCSWSSSSASSSSLSSRRRGRPATRGHADKGGAGRDGSHQAALMLRRTDSVVEKMLTNWLALNMYDHLRQGPAGRSLYLLLEALRCQLERGPIDAISGDAYYSLNESKLLREPAQVQFEPVNLYVIVDADVLRPPSDNLLLDNSMLGAHQQPLYDHIIGGSLTLPGQDQTRPTSCLSASQPPANSVMLAVRVLDCDTISQVKGKILSVLHRNSGLSRLSVQEVELSLRQHRPVGPSHMNGIHTLVVQKQQQYVTVALNDEDFSSMSSYTGARRLNTLRHYGVTDQAIVMLKRRSGALNGGHRMADMLGDDHYSNPYTEIQYGQVGGAAPSRTQGAGQHERRYHRQHQPCAADKWHLSKCGTGAGDRTSGQLHEDASSPASHSPSMMLLAGHQHHAAGLNQQQQFYQSSSSTSSTTGNVLDTNSTSAHSSSVIVGSAQRQQQQQLEQMQQPIYCQIGSNTTQSQHGGGGGGDGGSVYYCQVGQPGGLQSATSPGSSAAHRRPRNAGQADEAHLSRMLASKGAVQKYIDQFFKTILTVRAADSAHSQRQFYVDAPFGGAPNPSTTRRRAPKPTPEATCPAAVKWVFDLLDEAALRNGISNQRVISAWKSNAFLLRFWVNFVKNPNYILDVDKSSTLDASLSTIAQTLMDSCALPSQERQDLRNDNNRLIFARDLPRYRDQVRRFYQDVASMPPVSDQEMVKQMGNLSTSANVAGKFDTRLALKELCVYAVNYGVEIMQTLQADGNCQQLDLPAQLEQCFRSFTIFEAYQ